MNGWQSFTPTYTYKRKWYERFMFWRPKPKSPTAIYKQVGKVVNIKIKTPPTTKRR